MYNNWSNKFDKAEGIVIGSYIIGIKTAIGIVLETLFVRTTSNKSRQTTVQNCNKNFLMKKVFRSLPQKIKLVWTIIKRERLFYLAIHPLCKCHSYAANKAHKKICPPSHQTRKIQKNVIQD